MDPYYSSSNIPKYTYFYTRSSYKNTKEKYTSELPSDCTQHYKIFNIYYEGDDDIYQDTVIKSDYESSLHKINKEDQRNNKNEEGQKLSGTISCYIILYLNAYMFDNYRYFCKRINLNNCKFILSKLFYFLV